MSRTKPKHEVPSQYPDAEQPLPGDLNERLWSQQEVADFLGCTIRHLYSLRRRGLLECYKFGETVRYSPTHVRALMGKCRVGADKPDAEGRVQL